MENKIILKVLVGSHAHGLANKKSDYDYRAVYVQPTSQILSLNHNYKANSWIEGVEDNTAYEIGHFLFLATKCNPTILEVFRAPVKFANEDGVKLRSLFEHVWEPKRSYDAFCGYGLNQRKKFLDRKDNRQDKYACAYGRTLYHLVQLLETGNFDTKIPEGEIRDTLLKFKKGKYLMGDVINFCEDWTNRAKIALEKCKEKKTDIEKINNFLLDIRKKYW